MSDVPAWEAAFDGSAPPAAAPGETADFLLGTGFEVPMDGDPRLNDGANLRFRMRPNSERIIIFVTDGPRAPVCWEHNVAFGGNDWGNFFTCLDAVGKPCDLCKWAHANGGKFARYKAQYFTVIDTSEFVDSKKVTRKNERRVLAAKKKTTEILKRKWVSCRERGQSFVGAAFKVFRPDDKKSSSVGEDFEFLKMVKLEDFPTTNDPNKRWFKDGTPGEVDWAKYLRPSPEKVKMAVERLNAGGGGGGYGGGSPGAGPEGPSGTEVSF